MDSDWDLRVTLPKSRGQFIRWNICLVAILIVMCAFFITIKSRPVGCFLAPVGIFWFGAWNPRSGSFWYSGKAVRFNLAMLGGYLALRGLMIDVLLMSRKPDAPQVVAWPAEIFVALIPLIVMLSMFRSELKKPWR